MPSFSRAVLCTLSLSLVTILSACSGGGSGSSGEPPGGSTCSDGKESFASTWEGIQKTVLEKHGCTEQVCHGSAKSGGLDLSPEAAYANLFEKRALSSSLNLIEPGDNDRSYLWLKLAAKTNPGSVEIAGAPMPNNLPAISADELELLRRWIYAGAPETGTVIGTEELLAACLPPPEPIKIQPLEPPPPGKGFQLTLAPWNLPKRSEAEVCFATYFDVSDQVPAEYRDPSGELFRFKGFDLRQDPQSHHLILYFPQGNFRPEGVDVNDPAFGTWTCKGGAKAGEVCPPKEIGFCGEDSLCTSEPKPTFACVGYGPDRRASFPVGGAQQANAYNLFEDGVFAQLPTKGVLYWNSHAFNLTDKDAVMAGRINYLFADDQRFPARSIFQTKAIFKAKTPPYQVENVCSDTTLPKGARLYELTSHTHKHGKNFTAFLPDGTKIYDSFVYNDPVRQRYSPPLAFDSDDEAQRTIKYCSLYNNGVKEDGSPDPEFVTRLSRVPPQGFTCTPTHCAAGRVGATCAGKDDDATCDSSPGAGDGDCDACPITGGESTENEMFLLIGSYYLDPNVAGSSSLASVASVCSATDGEIPPTDSRGRSLATGPIFPPPLGCGLQPGSDVHTLMGFSSPQGEKRACH